MSTYEFPIAIRIAQIKQLQGRILEKILKDGPDSNLHGPQLNILFQLWQGDNISISELSEKTKLANTTLTSMLDRMEKQQLLFRISNPDNRRETKIILSDYAKKLNLNYQQLYEEMSCINFKGFSEEERNQLFLLLEKLHHNLDNYLKEERKKDK